MAYAISEADAAKAPKLTDGEDTYVKEMYLKGTKYYLYVHRFLSPTYTDSCFLSIDFSGDEENLKDFEETISS